MQLFIRSNETHLLDCSDTTTTLDIKNEIAKLENLAVEDQVLYACGKPLSDDDCVASFGTIDVCVRLLGGKVHGSLARAGKVKGQTPKVEKQEKKKKKTGRAKRRIQYNRRFVNVVATFGKRKGPNANS
uniref:FUBI n=1 Tax=Hemiscolopendra marginata TaxID=943146 RepID=A0A646QCV6_9MYRI